MAKRLISTGNAEPISSGTPNEPDNTVRTDGDNIGTGTDEFATVDLPDTGDGGTPGGGTGRRRGRPPGSRNTGTTARKTPQLDLSGVEKILFSLHTHVASMAKLPELAIPREEINQMCECAAKVAEHYPMVNIAPKTMAWVNLAM